MAANKQVGRRQKRGKLPLDDARLRDLALSYVARYATSSAKLERYLHRKLRELGWAEGAPQADIPALVSRYVELGYVDDEGFARARSGSLLRRGYGIRRVNQALGQDGIATAIREDVAPGEAEQRHAVLALVRKRRFGPFGKIPLERDRREKQIAAILRAGHSLDFAREMVDATSEEAAEQWAHELDEEPHDGTI
jgi:regulatory protein